MANSPGGGRFFVAKKFRTVLGADFYRVRLARAGISGPGGALRPKMVIFW